MAGMETPKNSMENDDAVSRGSGSGGGVDYFHSAHLVSALVVKTSSPGSFLTIL